MSGLSSFLNSGSTISTSESGASSSSGGESGAWLAAILGRFGTEEGSVAGRLRGWEWESKPFEVRQTSFSFATSMDQRQVGTVQRME